MGIKRYLFLILLILGTPLLAIDPSTKVKNIGEFGEYDPDNEPATLADEDSPDCENVVRDEGSLRMRYGSSAIGTVATATKFKQLFTFTDVAGNDWLIRISSFN